MSIWLINRTNNHTAHTFHIVKFDRRSPSFYLWRKINSSNPIGWWIWKSSCWFQQLICSEIICDFFISTQARAGWSKVCNVYAFIYVNRFIEEIKIAPCFFNWQKLLLISLVLAQKYIDDVPLANVDIPTVISRLDPALTSEIQGLNLQEVNNVFESQTFVVWRYAYDG